MVFDFLQPISPAMESFISNLSNKTLGKRVVFHTQSDFPILEGISLAIITVNENRGNGSKNEEVSFDNFRKQFYSLFPGNWNVSIADSEHNNEPQPVQIIVNVKNARKPDS